MAVGISAAPRCPAERRGLPRSTCFDKRRDGIRTPMEGQGQLNKKWGRVSIVFGTRDATGEARRPGKMGGLGWRGRRPTAFRSVWRLLLLDFLNPVLGSLVSKGELPAHIAKLKTRDA